MPLNQIQLEGDAARLAVRQRWPAATSTYIGTCAAQVYDPQSGAILGRAQADEFSVEHAWVAAASCVQDFPNHFSTKD